MACDAYFDAAKLANGMLVPLDGLAAREHSVKRFHYDTGASEQWRAFCDRSTADLVYELYVRL